MSVNLAAPFKQVDFFGTEVRYGKETHGISKEVV